MIYRYEIRKLKNEEILYLFIQMNYEFSKELDSEDMISNKINNYISSNNIKYNGNKIYLVSNGIVIKVFLKEEKEKQLESSRHLNNNYIININYNGIIKKISLKNYLLGVLASNSLPGLELTTLKALAVLYRTYAFKKMEENNFIDYTDSFQKYKSISYYKFIFRNEYQKLYNRIEKAVSDTDGEFIVYNNNYIYPYTHISNNGSTDNSKYDYLKAKASLWDYAYPNYLDIIDYDINYLAKLFNMDKEEVKKIKVLNVSKSRYIKEIKINNTIYSGEEFKNILNLRSTDINIIINPTYIRFITKGNGNGIGLSQFGANEMAKAGYSYTSILRYYYDNIKIKKFITKKQV